MKKKKKKIKATISKTQFSKIASIFVETSYWSMEKSFSNGITDGQTITTYMEYKNNQGEIFKHQISNYMQAGPQKLNDLQKQV